MSRRKPDGHRLSWKILQMGGHPWGTQLPFWIEWGPGTEHPSQTAPQGCRLVEFNLTHPQADDLSRLLKALGLGNIDIQESNHSTLQAKLETPRGLLELS